MDDLEDEEPAEPNYFDKYKELKVCSPGVTHSHYLIDFIITIIITQSHIHIILLILSLRLLIIITQSRIHIILLILSL